MSDNDTEDDSTKRSRRILWALLVTILLIVLYTQVTFFALQPIGAVPEGRTIVMWRTGTLKFVDSADAVCQREAGGVSLLCRGAILDAVAKSDKTILRLPYSDTLYLASTGGARYSK